MFRWPQHTTYTELWEISMCAESELLEVKVPIVFSARRVSRHPGTSVNQPAPFSMTVLTNQVMIEKHIGINAARMTAH